MQKKQKEWNTPELPQEPLNPYTGAEKTHVCRHNVTTDEDFWRFPAIKRLPVLFVACQEFQPSVSGCNDEAVH